MIDIQFVMAGRAVFTVENNKNEHFTYKVKRSTKKDNTRLFISVMTGGAGEYTYVGMLTPRNNVVPTKASKFKSDSATIEVFNFAMRIITGCQKLPDGYDIRHEGKCGACGRKLTEPTSLDSGLGPKCRRKLEG